jgi:UTP--glucose-1-phosphate uridylyltransferase
MKGLGHAVWHAKAFVGDSPFAVLLGDDIMMADKPVTKQLIEAAEKYNASAVGTQKVSLDDISKYSSLKVSALEDRIHKVSDMNEKPTPEEAFSEYAILGRYILTSEIFDMLENTSPGYGGEIQLTDGLRTLCKQADMVAVDFEGKRYDTGNLAGYLETMVDFALRDANVGDWFRDFIAGKV